MNLFMEARSGSRRVLALLAVVSLIGLAFITASLSTRAQVTIQTIQTIDPVSSGTDVTILGAAADDHLSGNGASGDLTPLTRARALTVGDFDNDGIDDLVIGAPDANVNLNPQGGPVVDRPDAGIVYVISGRTTPFPATIDAAIQGQTTLRILGRASGDRTGFAVASGDVNNDGIDDLLIGSPGSDFSPERLNNGSVTILLGSDTFATGTLDLNTANAADFIIQGVAAEDAFGSAIASGNVGGITGANDFTSDDIVIGAPGNDGPVGTRPGAGAAYVRFGGAIIARGQGGVTGTIDFGATPSQVNVVVFGRTGDALGSALSIGDVNAGNANDIVIGAPGADRPAKVTAPAVPAAADTGAVYVVFGGENIATNNGAIQVIDTGAATPSAQLNVSIFGEGSKLAQGGNNADRFGSSVAVGDVTGDGNLDLIVGAPDADGPADSRTDGGEAYVFLGGPGLNAARIDVFNNPVALTVFGQAGDHLGATVFAGQVNSPDNTDARADLIVGAPSAVNGRGSVSIFFGGPSLIFLSTRDIALGQDDVRILGEATGDELGWAITAGDFDDNTGGDLALGAPFAAAVVGQATRSDAGKVYLLLAADTDAPPQNENPVVEVTEPDGGEVIVGGTTFEIAWTASDPNGDDTIQRFEIRLSTDGGATFPDPNIIALAVPGTARTFEWAVPIGLNTTTARIQVTAVDLQGGAGSDTSDANFTISDTGATVMLTAPNGGERLIFGQTFNITWTVPAGVANQIRGFDIFLSTDGGATFPIPIAFNSPLTPALPADARTFAWTVPNICTTTARVLIAATNVNGTTSSDTSNANFAIGSVGPTVNTANIRITTNNTRIAVTTTTPTGGTEVRFLAGATFEVTDANGVFFPFTNAQIKKGGRKLIGRGQINGMTIGQFFPEGAVRTIRITNPPCGVVTLQVRREGNRLVVVTTTLTKFTFN
ncbi:MAG TPA: hypothetical protein VE262_18140 [Blastocatellia bacterium]|nr:hypothetical protein [Blastocatellia bacterium]